MQRRPPRWKSCEKPAGLVSEGLTQVIGAGSSLRDGNKCGPGRDVQDLVVTVGNGEVLEASRHLSAGGLPPAAKPAFVNHGAGAQDPIAALGLPGEKSQDRLTLDTAGPSNACVGVQTGAKTRTVHRPSTHTSPEVTLKQGVPSLTRSARRT